MSSSTSAAAPFDRTLMAARADGATAGIVARLERLPLTGYQRGLFAVIATAWFFDSMDLGALTFLLGSIRTEFQLSPAQAGLLSSMSFVGMFLGAATRPCWPTGSGARRCSSGA